MVKTGKLGVHTIADSGVSLLAMAAASNQIEFINTLLENGANVDYHGIRTDYTPIMEAVLNGNIEAVKILIAAKADLTVLTSQNFSVLHIACYQGNLEILKLLVENGATFELDYQSANEFYSPFLEAISKNHRECFKYLAKKFPEKLVEETMLKQVPNKSRMCKTTSFTLACVNKDIELVKFIQEIKIGYNLNIIDEYYQAFEEAALSLNLEIAKLLIDFKADLTDVKRYTNYPLSVVCSLGSLEYVKFLIKNNFPVDYQNFEGVTPLMEASKEGCLEIVLELLKNKANVNLYTKSSCESAISFAASMGNLEIVKLLVSKGTKMIPLINIALIEATRNYRMDVIEYLLSIGVPVNVTSPFQQETPLAVACDYGYNDLAKFFIEKGANVNPVLQNTFTPLMRAAKYGNVELVNLIISKGGDVNAILNNRQHTALSLACLHGQMEVVSILINAGADLLQNYEDDITLSMYASKSDNVKLFNQIYTKSMEKAQLEREKNQNLGYLNLEPTSNIENLNTKEASNVTTTPTKTSNKISTKKAAKAEKKAKKATTKDAREIKQIQKLTYEVIPAKSVESTPQSPTKNDSITKDRSSSLVDLEVKTQNTCESVLMHAVTQGNYNLVSSIISKGVDINQTERIKMTPLMVACFHGYTKIVKLLVSKGALLDEVCAPKHYTALFYAIANEKYDCMKILVDAKANMEIEALDSTTVLTLAAKKSSLDIVQYLVDKGAKVNPRRSGPTPLFGAFSNPNFEVIAKYLLKKGADPMAENNGRSFFGHVVLSNRFDLFKFICDRGIETEIKSAQCVTLVQECIMNNFTEMAKNLIWRGVDVNAIVQHPLKPSLLQVAVTYQNHEMVNLLLKRKANPNYKNKKNQSALGIACLQNDLTSVESLLRFNVDVDANDLNNELPICIAFKYGYTGIVRLLVEKIRVFPSDTEAQNISSSGSQLPQVCLFLFLTINYP